MPILILRIVAEVEDKVSLLNCGADDYLTKPYAFSELSARVKALLRRPQNVEGKALMVESLSLDRETYSFIYGGKTEYLTPKEFMLLEYLMKNAGRVVSRGMILEHVWDDSADQFSKSIETHIMNLRKKIDLQNKDAFFRHYLIALRTLESGARRTVKKRNQALMFLKNYRANLPPGVQV